MKQIPSSLIPPAAWKVRPAPQTRTLVEQSSRRQERKWQAPRQVHLPQGTGSRKKNPLCSPPTTQAAQKRDGWNFGASVAQRPHPRVNGPTDVLSYQQQSYSPSFGEEWVRTFPLTLPSREGVRVPLSKDWLRQEWERDFPLQDCRELETEQTGFTEVPNLGEQQVDGALLQYDGLYVTLTSKRWKCYHTSTLK